MPANYKDNNDCAKSDWWLCEGLKTDRFAQFVINEAIHYHNSDAAPIFVMSQRNFWHMVLKIVVNRYPTKFAYKKYLIQ